MVKRIVLLLAFLLLGGRAVSAQGVTFRPGWDSESGALPSVGAGYFESLPLGDGSVQGFSLTYAARGFLVSGGVTVGGEIEFLHMGPTFTAAFRFPSGAVLVPVSPLVGVCRMGGDGVFDYGVSTGIVWGERYRPGVLAKLTKGVIEGCFVFTF